MTMAMDVDAVLDQHPDVDAIKNIIERSVSIKYLTLPPFAITIIWGQESRVTTGAEEVTVASMSATPGRAR